MRAHLQSAVSLLNSSEGLPDRDGGEGELTETAAGSGVCLACPDLFLPGRCAEVCP